MEKTILMGRVTGAHGVRGEVKLQSFAQIPEAITRYGALMTSDGSLVQLSLRGSSGDRLIGRIEGVTSREMAEAWRGCELFVPRSALPAAKAHEYYHEDLIGCEVFNEEGARYGVVRTLANFGAGDVIVIVTEAGEEQYFPFTRAIFPHIDPAARRLQIAPPEIVSDD